MAQTCIHAAAANTRGIDEESGISFNATEQNPADEHSCLDPLPDTATPTRVQQPNNLPAEDTEQPPGPQASMWSDFQSHLCKYKKYLYLYLKILFMEEQNAGKKKKLKRFSTGDANSHNLLENRTLSMPKKKNN